MMLFMSYKTAAEPFYAKQTREQNSWTMFELPDRLSLVPQGS